MAVVLCSRVTGSADPQNPHGIMGRRGDLRPDGRIEVLCSATATWLVGTSRSACDRDLAIVAKQTGERFVVITRLATDPPPERERS